MPRPDATDDVGVNNELRRIWDIHRTDADGDAGSDRMRAGIDLVRQIVEPLGYPPERLHFVEGMVDDTIPTVMPSEIALVRFDTDFYSSMKHELVHLYPRLASSGVLIIGDYGAMPGRRAVDEYSAEHQLRWFLTRLLVKPRDLVGGFLSPPFDRSDRGAEIEPPIAPQRRDRDRPK